MEKTWIITNSVQLGDYLCNFKYINIHVIILADFKIDIRISRLLQDSSQLLNSNIPIFNLFSIIRSKINYTIYTCRNSSSGCKRSVNINSSHNFSCSLEFPKSVNIKVQCFQCYHHLSYNFKNQSLIINEKNTKANPKHTCI